MQLLVSHGATVDLTGGLDKWTALFYAALAGHAEVVGFLLAIGKFSLLVTNLEVRCASSIFH